MAVTAVGGRPDNNSDNSFGQARVKSARARTCDLHMSRPNVFGVLPDVERRHVLSGPEPGERSGGDGLVDFTVHGPGNASEILTRTRGVVIAVLDHSEPWPGLDEWERIMPAWFVTACAPEQTREEAESWLAWWRTLSSADRAAAEVQRGWSLSNWLYWLEPEKRDWYWWDGRQLSNDTAKISVEVIDSNAPLGSFRWLLRAAGAVQAEDSRT